MMMRKAIVRQCLIGGLLTVGLATSAVGAEVSSCAVVSDRASCSPKVDNFILFVDQSGSMYQTHAEAGEVKELLVKRLLGQMNEHIPQLCYKGGLYLFAPFAQVKWMGQYHRSSMQTRISWIPDSQPVGLRLTPMGGGISDLNGVVGGLSGKTAVIVFSDGGQNTGEDPVAAAQELVRAHPGVCLHVVSFADTPSGQEVNREVSKAGQGCLHAEGTDLLRDGTKLQQFVRDVFCEPVKAKRRIVLRGVNFDFDEATIRPDGKAVLDEGIRALNEEPGVTISVEGHTDSVGSDHYNEGLSERRAHAVADYLAAGGIKRSRMSTVGLGEAKPVASNETEDGRAQNRRVEFRIIAQ